MKFHEVIVMAIAILGIQAGVYRRPMPQLDGTYLLTLTEVVKDQAIPLGFQAKLGRGNT